MTLSVDPTSTEGSCSFAPSGTLKFNSPGTCVLEAGQGGNGHWAAAITRRDIPVLAGKPVAATAGYTISTGSVLRVTARNGVLAKDRVNGATISSHTAPTHGSLTLLPTGAFTYIPRPSFSGTDHFTYTLRNSLGRSTAIVSIQVRDLVRSRAQGGRPSSGHSRGARGLVTGPPPANWSRHGAQRVTRGLAPAPLDHLEDGRPEAGHLDGAHAGNANELVFAGGLAHGDGRDRRVVHQHVSGYPRRA